MITGGLLVDGTGAAAVQADVAITGKLIAAVGEPGSLRGQAFIDASGLVVAPGFFDIHSHADFTIVLDRRAQSALAQGVTSIVTGNCGHGVAPLPETGAPSGAFGWQAGDDGAARWRTFDEYLRVLREPGVGVNVFPLIAHGALRACVIGAGFRPATATEIADMAVLTTQAMGAGAVGFSTGMEYAPGACASTAELTAISAAAGEYGGLYATHCRNRTADMLAAAAEAIDVAAAGNCRLQLSHFLPRPMFGDHGPYHRAVELARSARLPVLFDAFPFEYGPTALCVMLPSWVRQGSRAEVAGRLASRGLRRSIVADLDSRFGEAERSGVADDMYVASDGRDGYLAGRTLGELSRGGPIADAVLDLLAAAGEDYFAVTVAERWATSADLDAALGCDDYLIMGDGVTAGSDGPLRGRGFCLSDWGYAPAMLATYVRDRAVVGLEQAVHRMTMAPARQAGVFDRGVIAPGFAADIVAFDLTSLAASADPARLHEPPSGVRDVLVNGRPAVRHGQLTGALAGRVGVWR